MDRVVGNDRAPQLADFEHLPFLQACVKEVGNVFAQLPSLSYQHELLVI